MNNKVLPVFGIVLTVVGFKASLAAVGTLRPDRVSVADQKVTPFWKDDGVFIGGDHSVQDIIVHGVRRGGLTRDGYERVVIDMEANQNGEPTVLSRPPFYHVAISPEEEKVVMTLSGNPILALDSRKIVSSFVKSKIYKEIKLYPKLEPNSWTFELALRKAHRARVFELSNPVRVVIDVKAN